MVSYDASDIKWVGGLEESIGCETYLEIPFKRLGNQVGIMLLLVRIWFNEVA
jgi:hypothetical protein